MRVNKIDFQSCDNSLGTIPDLPNTYNRLYDQNMVNVGKSNGSGDWGIKIIEKFESHITPEFSFEWKSNIKLAKSCQEIFSIFEKLKLIEISDRLKELDLLIKDDPNENDMNLKSLKNMANFVIKNNLSDFMIGIVSDGFIQIEWHLSSNGIIVLEFLESDNCRFVIIFPENNKEPEQLEASGALDNESVLCIIKKII